MHRGGAAAHSFLRRYSSPDPGASGPARSLLHPGVQDRAGSDPDGHDPQTRFAASAQRTEVSARSAIRSRRKYGRSGGAGSSRVARHAASARPRPRSATAMRRGSPASRCRPSDRAARRARSDRTAVPRCWIKNRPTKIAAVSGTTGDADRRASVANAGAHSGRSRCGFETVRSRAHCRYRAARSDHGRPSRIARGVPCCSGLSGCGRGELLSATADARAADCLGRAPTPRG